MIMWAQLFFETNRKILFAVLFLVPTLLGATPVISHGQNMTSSPCTDKQTCYNEGFAYGKIYEYTIPCYAGIRSAPIAGPTLPTWFYNASTSQQENYCSGYNAGLLALYNANSGTPGNMTAAGNMTPGNITPSPSPAATPLISHGQNTSSSPYNGTAAANMTAAGNMTPGPVTSSNMTPGIMTTTSQPQTQTTGSFVGYDFGDFHNIPLIGGMISRSTGVLHNEQGIFIPWTVTCPKVQQYLVEPCSSLINPDGSLTSEGDRAIGCIRNGLAIAVANAHTINLPFGTLRGLLGGLAGATGCGGIVNLNQIQNTDMFQFLLHSVNIGP